MADKNNIESFFKNRLEDHEFPFQESDWMLLEERLNAAGMNGESSSGGMSLYVKIILLAAALSLAFLLGWFVHDRLDISSNSPNATFNDSKNAIYSESRQGHVDEATSGSIDSESNILQENSFIEKNTPPAVEGSINNKENQLNNQNESGFENTASSSSTVDITSKELTIQEQRQTLYEESSDVISGDSEASKNEIEDKKEANHGQNLTRQYKQTSDPMLYQSETMLFPLSPKDGFLTAPLFNRLDFVPRLDHHAMPENEQLNPFVPAFHRWSIGFSVASDFTSVGLDEQKSLAMRGGGHLFFALSPRFTLGTGVVFSDKKYATDEDYYAPPEGYWAARTNGVIPDQIDGSCKVVDIPLNVSFAALSREEFLITATGGISSYLLLDEIYTFTFNQNNPGAANGWKTEDNSFAPFSIINLAAGITIFPKNKIYTGLDVFYKIPVKQVGWGNVELHSMGIQLLLKYRL